MHPFRQQVLDLNKFNVPNHKNISQPNLTESQPTDSENFFFLFQLVFLLIFFWFLYFNSSAYKPLEHVVVLPSLSLA